MATPQVRVTGRLSTWDDARGFGFISRASGRDIFVHISAFPADEHRPEIGDELSFVVEPMPDGRSRAAFVRFSGGARPLPTAGHGVVEHSGPRERLRLRIDFAGVLAILTVVAFVVLVFVVSVVFGLPPWVPSLYIAASIGCFVIYAVDKISAVRGRWRVRESTLILLGLVGGWPGAVIAQQLFRHKTRKAAFRTMFWVSVVINVVVFAILTASPLSHLLTPA
ncbi:DUF1294 domain-containing protein [Schumannella soli]|uniref:DUF1294 domain-containing protein n=1 Tax=Schumannella soli TaxID=2590779 RepID=A0A506Y159_9MICO|nr:DUF1294 domain-containing protein [Schumannella soli]TPW75682.1 DUF1294 domain-containing protein [Schumannella soli]